MEGWLYGIGAYVVYAALVLLGGYNLRTSTELMNQHLQPEQLRDLQRANNIALAGLLAFPLLFALAVWGTNRDLNDLWFAPLLLSFVACGIGFAYFRNRSSIPSTLPQARDAKLQGMLRQLNRSQPHDSTKPDSLFAEFLDHYLVTDRESQDAAERFLLQRPHLAQRISAYAFGLTRTGEELPEVALRRALTAAAVKAQDLPGMLMALDTLRDFAASQHLEFDTTCRKVAACTSPEYFEFVERYLAERSCPAGTNRGR